MWIKLAGHIINLDNVTSISISNENIIFYFGSSRIREEEELKLNKGEHFNDTEFSEAKKSLEEKLAV